MNARSERILRFQLQHMNILILLDLAPNYHPMLVEVGKALEAGGHRTYYAIDSPLNLWRYREHAPAGEYRVFSEFLARHHESQTAPDFPWTTFFPDFDRFEVFGVNHGRKQGWYLHLASALSAFFRACVHDWDIDAIVYEGVNNSFAWFANQAGDEVGARYVGLQASRLPGRHELHGPTERVMAGRVEANYRKVLSEGLSDSSVEEWVTEYLEGFAKATPDYMASSGLLLQNPVTKYGKVEKLQALWRLASYQVTRRAAADQSYRSGPPLSYYLIGARRNVARWLRAHTLGSFFTSPAPDQEEFYLYPLHFHPEASTSVCSRWYVDEYPVIKNLAFSLPPGRWLYVKDHPSAVGYPSRDFYQRVAALPNVKLIPPGSDTKSLIKWSLGVITQTSTVGYEALVLGKPVWALGQVFYDFHEGCRKIGWTEDIEDRLSRPDQEAVPEGAGPALVAAYYLSTEPGALPLQGEGSGTASFEQLAREIGEQAASTPAVECLHNGKEGLS